MTGHVFTTLRAANAARQAEWDAGAQIGLSYRGNEQAGEVGEALEAALDVLLQAVGLIQLGAAAGRASNIIKKLDRERLGIRGSRATLQDLGDELGDVVICADLVALALGIDLDRVVAAKFNATSEKVGLQTRLALAGDRDLLLDLLKRVVTTSASADVQGAADAIHDARLAIAAAEEVSA